MMITIVNGYVCYSSCDEATAKQGKDPHAPPGSLPGTSGKDKTGGFDAQPATVLDGALKDALSADALKPAGNSQAPGRARPASVNLLV
jgi:hypothetical protein